jgi:hypothetical protein
VSYSIDVDPGAQDAIVALPHEALLALAETFAVLELAPWSVGRSVNPERNPDSGVRNLPFGAAGMVTYLIVEHERRVDILLVTWAEPGDLS